jgi:HAD superfamily hydrolase (TIGR01509 family)
MVVKALVFDVDGTLAETERDGHRVAFNAAFDAAGLGWSWGVEEYGPMLRTAGGKERIRRFAAENDPGLLARPDADELVAALHADKTARYGQIVAGGSIGLRPGVARLIDEARTSGVRLAIATTTHPDNVTALLRATLGPDADSWFDVIGAGDVVAQKKPAPDVYTWVLERLDLDPGQCLAVEDSATGLAAALAAGVPTVVTPAVYTRGEDFTGAVAVLPDLDGVGLADLVALHDTASSDTPE